MRNEQTSKSSDAKEAIALTKTMEDVKRKIK